MFKTAGFQKQSYYNMQKDLKNIDKLFHNNLEGAGEQPPAFVWDGIANALDDAAETKRIGILEKRKRYSIALLLLLMMGSAALLLDMNGRKAELKAITAVAAPIGKSSIDAGNKDKGTTAGAGYSAGIAQENRIEEVETVMSSHFNDPYIVSDVTEKGNNNFVETAMPVKEMITTPALFVKQETVSTEIAKPFVSPVYTLLQSSQVISKSATVQTRRKSRFAVSFFFAPDITTRNLEQDLGSTALDERKEEMLKTEKNGKLDFTFGGRIEYQLNKHVSLLSGISFSTNTIDIAKKTVYARYDKRDGALKYRFNMSSGYSFFRPKKIPPPMVLGDSTEVASSSSILHYINIPFAVKYSLPSGRFNFFMQAGITAKFITKQSVSAEYAYNGEKEKSTSTVIYGLKTNYFNGVVGLGADYAVNQRLAIIVSPTFNFATSSINRDAPVKAYPNTLSIATGIRLQL